VVVDDELRPSVEDVGEPDWSALADERVVVHLDHREPATLRGDGVELARRSLLASPKLVELLSPGLLIDDRRLHRFGHAGSPLDALSIY
jgi:hypothetical protein